ncbi:MAG: hypothetical protein JWQ72_2419 [Polaromonas sp.]|nr:hypothetical protein [Polaromonas sp.]
MNIVRYIVMAPLFAAGQVGAQGTPLVFAVNEGVT